MDPSRSGDDRQATQTEDDARELLDRSSPSEIHAMDLAVAWEKVPNGDEAVWQRTLELHHERQRTQGERLIAGLATGHRYRITYNAGHWSSGGGSLSPIAHIADAVGKLVPSDPVGPTEEITLELTGLDPLHVTGRRVRRFGGLAKGVVSIGTHGIVAIVPA